MPSTNQPAPEEACLPTASQSGRELDWISHEQRLNVSVVFWHRMYIVGPWFEDFVELCELMALGLRMSREQLEGTTVAFFRCVDWLARWSGDGVPRKCDSLMDHDPHR